MYERIICLCVLFTIQGQSDYLQYVSASLHVMTHAIYKITLHRKLKSRFLVKKDRVTSRFILSKVELTILI